MRSRPVLLFVVCAAMLAAQTLDTGGLEPSAAGPPEFRAESAAERGDFTAISGERDPKRRRALAMAFITRYSRSWLLASVYQLAAAASLEIEDYPDALTQGRRSLRLLPENPALLIALANVEAGTHHAEQARRDAGDALLWLSVLAPPAGMKAAEWNATRATLEQGARLILSRTGGSPPAPATPDGGKLTFAGSESCRPCHQSIYDAWRKTGMARMLSPLGEVPVLADFSTPHEYRDANDHVAARFGGGARPYFEFDRGAGGWKRYPVTYTIGSKWQQAYATELPDGRIFVFPIQFNKAHGTWVDYWETIDRPSSERAQIALFPQLSPAFSYQRNCAVCHTSQLRLAKLDDATLERALFREPGVDCEMCHGPSAEHAAAMRAGRPEAGVANAPPFRFSRLDAREATLICGQCHRQSAVRVLGRGGEMNFTREAPYFRRLSGQPPGEMGSRAIYRDGRFRETTYIGEAFMRSACFLRGGAQCASCHDPHPGDAESNPASLKFRAEPDRMCLQCHAQIARNPAAHTHHAAASAASRCTACHMPPIMDGLMAPAASHQIDDIPSIEMTARFGPRDSPNACLICHADKDLAWLAGELGRWQR